MTTKLEIDFEEMASLQYRTFHVYTVEGSFICDYDYIVTLGVINSIAVQMEVGLDLLGVAHSSVFTEEGHKVLKITWDHPCYEGEMRRVS